MNAHQENSEMGTNQTIFIDMWQKLDQRIQNLICDQIKADPKGSVATSLGVKSPEQAKQTLEILYSSFFKPSRVNEQRGATYPPSISPKIATQKDTTTNQDILKTTFWNEQFQPYQPVDSNCMKIEVNVQNVTQIVPRRSIVECILQVRSIMIIGKKLVMSVRLAQMLIKPPVQLSGCWFGSPAPVTASAPATAPVALVDPGFHSDDDKEDAEESSRKRPLEDADQPSSKRVRTATGAPAVSPYSYAQEQEEDAQVDD
jgi:hypothetical protein